MSTLHMTGGKSLFCWACQICAGHMTERSFSGGGAKKYDGGSDVFAADISVGHTYMHA